MIRFSEKLENIKKLILDGEFDKAYRLTYSLQDNDPCAMILIKLIEIALSDINSVNVNFTKVNLSLAHEKYFSSFKTVPELEYGWNFIMEISCKTQKSLKKNFEDLDADYKCQYKGSAGITFDSDDPAEQEKAQRERAIQKAHNDEIDRKRGAITEKYISIERMIFSSMIESYMLCADSFEKNNILHEFSLNFIDNMKGIYQFIDENDKMIVNTFIKLVKKSRNKYYWEEHQEIYQSLLSENRALKKQIQDILDMQLMETKEEVENATKKKEIAKKERKRYALFNRIDRKPLSNEISQSKKIIKAGTQKLENLNKGICEECEPLRARIREINHELAVQR